MANDHIILGITAIFIVGMIWFRTRMQYGPNGTGSLQLERAGRIYFGSVLALLGMGWALAPWLGRTLWPSSGATPTALRVLWFLATYYLFIVVHRILKTRRTSVFRRR